MQENLGFIKKKKAYQGTLTKPVCKSQNKSNTLFYYYLNKYLLKIRLVICKAPRGSIGHNQIFHKWLADAPVLPVSKSVY